jgi:hypothetical protein
MPALKEQHTAPETAVPASVIIELQRSFFSLVSSAEMAKTERIQAKKSYDEKAREFEEARRALFEVAEFLLKHQNLDQADACDWMAVAKARLEAVEQ